MIISALDDNKPGRMTDGRGRRRSLFLPEAFFPELPALGRDQFLY